MDTALGGEEEDALILGPETSGLERLSFTEHDLANMARIYALTASQICNLPR